MLFFGLILLFVTSQSGNLKEEDVTPEIFLIQACLENSGNNALLKLGAGGGDVYRTIPRLQMPDGRSVAYLYEEGFSYLPELKDITDDLESYSSTRMSECLVESNAAFSKPQVAATIKNNGVLFETKTDFTLANNQMSFTKSEFSSEVPYRLGAVYETTAKILAAIRKSDESPDMTFENYVQPHLIENPEFSLDFTYDELDLPSSVTVQYQFYSKDTTIWQVRDNDFSFTFAAKHIRRKP